MAELLSVPLKKSADVDIVKPLKNLIQSTYNTEDYNDALNELSRLRTNAIWKVFEKSSLEVIYSYYDQLVSLESKIPPQEVQIPFKWKDAFDKGSIFGGRMSLTVSSLAYERVCVEFNIAALQSAMAAAQALDSEDQLQQGAKLLQQAAGVFSGLKGRAAAAAGGAPTPDLQPDALHALHALMLAQAQELIAYKCIRDEMKDSMVARVCSGCAEMYGEAARALQREHLRPLWERDWLPTIGNKQQWFTGLAHLYQAGVCGASGAVGERVARLAQAAALLPAHTSHPVMQEQARRAATQLAAAQKDNDFIYHERVPPAEQLSAVPRTAVARALPPPPRYTANADLFARLAPAGEHRARQAAEARRADLVNAEVNQLRDDTQLLNSILASLNLPACVERGAEGAALPASILAKAGAVRAAGGLPALRALMQDLPQLLQRNKDILDEAERMLREEAEADDALRAQFGARWTRTPSAVLTETFRANALQYRQIIDNAVRADTIVQDKFKLHQRSMEQLDGSDSELSESVPAAAAGPDRDPAALQQLRDLMQQVAALKAERDSIESALKSSRLELEATGGAALDEAAVAEGIARTLGPLQARAAASRQHQERLLEQIQSAHSALMSARGGASGRDGALAALCAAHDAYQELTANLQEGSKFYNDLTQLLVAFQNKVSDYCFARRTEKEELLKDLTQDAARGSPAPPAAPSTAAAEEPAVAKRVPPPRPAPPAPAPAAAAAPAPAPLPYPAQPQGMPLPYGGGVAAPYPYYAPLPAGYNPYATLPYPAQARVPAPPYQPYQYPPPQPGQPYQPPPGGYNPYPQH